MKFEIGDLVYIQKEMPLWMKHFESGKFAIITGIGINNQYMTNIAGWYEEDQLHLIKRNPNNKLLKRLEISNEDTY
jgi:hypothetical protein